MHETYGKESKTERVRGVEGDKSLRVNADGSKNAERTRKRAGNQRLASDRKNRTEGIAIKNPIGGILDQLIEDAQKQLVKSQECIVWYQSEAKEAREKLENLKKLRELQGEELESSTTTEEDDLRS